MKRLKYLLLISTVFGLLLPVGARAALPFYLQGGNSFGETAELGTNDDFPLVFKTNNTERARIDGAGNLVLSRSVGSSSSSGSIVLQGVEEANDGQPGEINFVAGGTDLQVAQIFFENGMVLTVPSTDGSANATLLLGQNGNASIGDSFDYQPPQGTLQVAENSQSTLYIGSSESGSSGQTTGCMVLGDSDGVGVTYVTANNGLLAASTTKPDICE
jgi:hypothetical protein